MTSLQNALRLAESAQHELNAALRESKATPGGLEDLTLRAARNQMASSLASIQGILYRAAVASRTKAAIDSRLVFESAQWTPDRLTLAQGIGRDE